MLLADRIADTEPTAIRTHLGAIFVSLELSRSTWLITSLSPGNGEKMSKHGVAAGDIGALLAKFAELQRKAFARTGKNYPIITYPGGGAGRVLRCTACCSRRGSRAMWWTPPRLRVPRRRRRAKTDKIDGEALLRVLLAYKRGEPRVCSMVVAPCAEEEDRRRIGREREVLLDERIRHVNRIKGLLLAQGISGYAPLRRDRRARLEALRTADGRELPQQLRAQIGRELDRLELLLVQIKAVEAERDAMLARLSQSVDENTREHPLAMLLGVKGIGEEFAAALWFEWFYRSFANRRQIAAYAGLAATPWQSGSVAHEQGVSKAGNARLRKKLVQLAWLWLRHQPGSALARWFHAQAHRKVAIVALARKLLVALWKYVTAGVVIEGAALKGAA